MRAAAAPGSPEPGAKWRAVEVDVARRVVRRPSGLELDLGGSVKGWAANFSLPASSPTGAAPSTVAGTCGCRLDAESPWEVRVRHPLTGAVAHTLRVRAGGVATSGIDARLWERRDGDYARAHLIDPATGTPAWTGLVAATMAPTALEAEALAKAALLSGPAAGRRLLRARYGGVLVHDDGAVDPIGSVLSAVDPPLDSVDQEAAQRSEFDDALHRSHSNGSLDAVNVVEPVRKHSPFVSQHLFPQRGSAGPQALALGALRVLGPVWSSA